jgi:hypothetical protein
VFARERERERKRERERERERERLMFNIIRVRERNNDLNVALPAFAWVDNLNILRLFLRPTTFSCEINTQKVAFGICVC